MTADDEPGAIVSAGGWCAPSANLYDLADAERISIASLLPEFRLLRPGSPEHIARQAQIAREREVEVSVQRMITRHIGDIRKAQDAALTVAYLAADDLNLDVLMQDPPPGHSMWRWSGDYGYAYRFVGLALVPRAETTARRLQGDRPVILHDTASSDFLDWDDD